MGGTQLEEIIKEFQRIILNTMESHFKETGG